MNFLATQVSSKHTQTDTRMHACTLTGVVEVESLDAVQHDLLLHKHFPPLLRSCLGTVQLAHPLQGERGGLWLDNGSELVYCNKREGR